MNESEQENVSQDINENLAAVTYIMLARIYDILVLLADGSGKGEDVLRLIKLHEQGQLMSPPPTLAFEDEDNDDDDS